MNVSRAKTEYMCLNGVSIGSIRMQDQQLPEVSEFRYLSSTAESDGAVEAEIGRRIQSGWNNWKKMAGVMCDKRVPATAMLYGLETVPQTKATRRLEVAEMKMCRWACGLTMRDRMRNDEIRERMGVTKIGLRYRSARLRWFGKAKRGELHRKENAEHGTTGKERKRASEATVDGQHQGRHVVRGGRRHPREKNMEGFCICRSDPRNGRSLKKIISGVWHRIRTHVRWIPVKGFHYFCNSILVIRHFSV
ncbi:uncharacterized protein LOC125026939 [Penaeus chinensis]|uniref:uncharacterized protein LOC125026939 n=1 Tax=Penaeus chinensis TaxID=139456 RepID=UPI001FB85D77|nr:uncharacterized protein LOC125026939 [Penaeus chinensis]